MPLKSYELEMICDIFFQSTSAMFSGVMISTNDKQRMIQYVNPAFEDLFGYDLKDLYACEMAMLFGPKSCRSVIDRFRQCIRDHELFDGQIMLYDQSGSSHLYHWRSMVYNSSRGHLSCVIQYFFPVTSGSLIGSVRSPSNTFLSSSEFICSPKHP